MVKRKSACPSCPLPLGGLQTKQRSLKTRFTLELRQKRGPSNFVLDLPRNPDFGGMAPVSKSRRDGRFEKVAGGYPAGDQRAPLAHGRPGYCFQSCVPAELQSASPGTSIVRHRIVLQSLWTREPSLKKSNSASCLSTIYPGGPIKSFMASD